MIPIGLILCACILFIHYDNTLSVSLLVPAYIYPTGNSATDWGALANASAQVPLVAVLNPNSGPGTAADPNYVQAVQRVQNGGDQVLGYVHTSYGARNLSDVRADIDAYLAFYPDVDGFFIDEMTNDASAASVQYYQSVYAYVKQQAFASAIVVGNPGTNVPEQYAANGNLADIFVVFESSVSAYSQYAPAQWQSNYSSSMFAHIVYGASSAQMQQIVQNVSSLGAEYVYVTSEQLPNPYGALPAYWGQEVAAAAEQNE